MRLLCVLLAVCALALPAAAAEKGKSGENAQRALAKAQALLKQVNAQKAAAEAELAKLQADVAEKDKTLAKLQTDLKARDAALKTSESSLAEAKQHGAALDGQLGSTRDRLEKTEAKLREMIEKYKAQAQTLQTTQAEKTRLESELATRTRELADATGRNRQLVEANGELVDRYRKKGFVDVLTKHEPFTGIGSVQTENVVQEYEERREDARLEGER